MNQLILRWVFIASIVSATGSAAAAQVGGLTSFTAGTTAKAAEVNANFSAVKSAALPPNGLPPPPLQTGCTRRVSYFDWP